MKPSKAVGNEEEKFAAIYQLSELIDDFFDINDQGIKVIKQYYIHNPVRSFKPVWKTFYGPADRFDMTLENTAMDRYFISMLLATCIF
jgi:hypothetical protein